MFSDVHRILFSFQAPAAEFVWLNKETIFFAAYKLMNEYFKEGFFFNHCILFRITYLLKWFLYK